MAESSQVGGKEGHDDAERSEVREPLCACKTFRVASPMCPHPLTGIAWGMEVREYYFEYLERDRRLPDRSASCGRMKEQKRRRGCAKHRCCSLTFTPIPQSLLGVLSLPKPHREEATETKR